MLSLLVISPLGAFGDQTQDVPIANHGTDLHLAQNDEDAVELQVVDVSGDAEDAALQIELQGFNVDAIETWKVR